MTQKRLIKITFPIVLLFGIYFLGPEPPKPRFDKVTPSVPSDPTALEDYIASKEKLHILKPDNEARIVWLDSTKKKTEYAVVYLHGFSASQREGDPVHRDFAKEFGCNLYLARLADHGVDTTEALLQFSGDRAWETAKEALAIGKQLGDKVIIMSTSTGGTLALMLAAEYPDDVFALINMSPNIAINNPAAFLLNDPWGLYISRIVMGSKYTKDEDPYNGNKEMSDERKKYWNHKYRMEATTQLEELLEEAMNEETFKKIKQPSLTLYYYKNEEEQDKTVKVSAMLEMHKLLATPDSLKVAVAIPNAGNHVLGSPLSSKDVEGVYREMEKFALEKLKLSKSQ